MSRTILIGGGARSGKSDLALALARRLGARRVFIATAQARDDEMRARIERHRADRGAEFHTLETPIDLVGALYRSRDYDVVVIDCLTLWLSNLLLANPTLDVEGHMTRLARALPLVPVPCILVTNEVGLGLVPDNPLGRAFRDHAGRLHRMLAEGADEIYLGALGVMLRLRPGPVTAVDLAAAPAHG